MLWEKDNKLYKMARKIVRKKKLQIKIERNERKKIRKTMETNKKKMKKLKERKDEKIIRKK